MNGSSNTVSLSRRNTVALVIAGLLAVLGARFFDYQVLHHDRYRLHAEANSIREVRLLAPRGIIYDRRGDAIVTNRPVYPLSVIPNEVSHSLDWLDGLSRHLGIPSEQIRATILEANRGPYERFQPVTLKDNVDFATRSILEEHRLEYPGIFFRETPIRHYPSPARATHTLGYLRRISPENLDSLRQLGYAIGDVTGEEGIEKRYQATLRGQDGTSYHLRDNLLRDLGELPGKSTVYPQPGTDLHLALDAGMQALAETLLHERKGALLAMDAATGELFALVSAPDYRLAPFTGPIPLPLWEEWRDHPDKILMNRAINGLYPPGSLFKLIAAADALADNRMDLESEFECTGEYELGNRIFHCLGTHGWVNMASAVRLSCNVYFYQLIQRLDFRSWGKMARQFGFGQATGVDLGNESEGLIPTPAYMDRQYAQEGWTTGHMLNLAVGQGELLLTPIQMARMMAAIANEGRLVVPTIVIEPRVGRPRDSVVDLEPKVWDFLRESMYAVVNGQDGTGFRARVEGGRVYGKTGSAENPHGESHAWFSGFLETPTGFHLVVTVLVENGGLGSRTAAPIAAEIFSYYLANYETIPGDELAQTP